MGIGVLRLMLVLLLPLAGCGGGSDSNQLNGEVPANVANSAVKRAQACIECHRGSVSPGTGKFIVDEYLASGHAAKNGAACPDCHAPSTKHSQSCQRCHGGGSNDPAIEVIKNPDEAGRCLICHGKTATRAPMVAARFPSEASHTHFPNVDPSVLDAPAYLGSYRFTGTATAGYVTAATTGKCRSCHNQHNNKLIPQFAEWAGSGHGNLNAYAFTYYDFKLWGTTGVPMAALTPQRTTYDGNPRNMGFCVRCHTSTGFVNYVTSGFRNVSSWGNPNDPEKQVLYCSACHYSDANGRSYNYTVRAPDAAKGFYNYSTAPTGRILMEVQYPNLNQSNNCMSCHVGWGSGPLVKQMWQNASANGFSDFFSASSYPNNYGTNLNSHYFTAGATMFRTIGYHFAGRNYQDESEYAHKLIGVGDFRGTTTRGPCVMCHVFPARMTLLPVKRTPAVDMVTQTGTITEIVSPVCSRCHDDSFQPAWTVARLNQVKEGFQAALDALSWQLQVKKGVYFTPQFYPYLFTTLDGLNAGTEYSLAFTDWGNIDTAGAAFNMNYLWHDFGAFAHNATYTKRLIYDSIDFLDDGQLNYSVGTTLNGWVPVDLASKKTKAMDYLLNPGAAIGSSGERF